MLVADEDPLLAVLDCPGGVGTDVAAALALGQEHPALPGHLGVERGELGQHVVADPGRGVTLHDVGGPSGHAQPAIHGGLGLADQIGERGGDHGRHWPTGVGGEPDKPIADQVGLVGQPRRVVDHLAHIEAPTVVPVEDGSVGVGDLGPGGQGSSHQVPVAGDVFLGERAVGGVGEVAIQQKRQVGIEGVPVVADGLIEFGVVGKHGIDRMPARFLWSFSFPLH